MFINLLFELSVKIMSKIIYCMFYDSRGAPRSESFVAQVIIKRIMDLLTGASSRSIFIDILCCQIRGCEVFRLNFFRLRSDR